MDDFLLEVRNWDRITLLVTYFASYSSMKTLRLQLIPHCPTTRLLQKRPRFLGDSVISCPNKSPLRWTTRPLLYPPLLRHPFAPHAQKRTKICCDTRVRGAFCFEYLESRPYQIYSVRTFCESFLASSRGIGATIASVKRYGDLNGVHIGSSPFTLFGRMERTPIFGWIADGIL